ncbi:choice-of-anchor L domain-containing protein [Phenylobacterium soli]|uniref:Dystroglycan-type cadherin-like domain-containing protein n=1 Tax=Phenylobacterium soli TaxID=2170551 RepID=A0A328AB36_9CAUL|nr:choice-of-anchor L domain-containing protein [Phenylobacterium soli]RAK51831.1 hypothetical protein DJ017_18615 [Phenylobacterium soli]
MPTFTVVDQAQIDANPTSVTNAFFPSSPGISLDAASLAIVHGTSSISFYDGSLAPLGIGAGLLITSGTVPGTANTVPDFGQDNQMVGDADLDAVVNTVFATSSFDATSIAFNFTVSDPSITGISFKVVFGTDEYPEWVDQFVDIGVVMVNGTNVAYFGNDPAAPLSVIGSNLAAGYFLDNQDGHLPIEYDGVSNVLTVFAPVHQGVNTLKIAIGDTGDHILDSGLFISGLTGTTTPVSGVSLDVTGTAGNDVTQGTGASENIAALAGNDSVNAAGGDDVVAGGTGDDTMAGGTGNDFLDGGDGSDVAVFSGASSDYQVSLESDGSYQVKDLAGLDGTDTVKNVESLEFSDGAFAPSAMVNGGAGIVGTAHDDVISLTVAPPLQPLATDAADTVSAGAGDDRITTGGGDDVIHTGADKDQVWAGAGDDTIYVDQGGDEIWGDAGTDTVVFSGASGDYLIAKTGDGYAVTDQRAGAPDGTTQLVGVEQAAFSDKTITLGAAAPVNHPPVISGPVTAAATEDGAAVGLNALANASDPDAGAVLTVVNVPTSLPAGVTYDAVTSTFTLDPANAAYQALGQGQQTTVTVNYGVSDGAATTAAQAVFTVTGVDDAPVVAAPIADAAGQVGQAFSLTLAQGVFSDVEGDVLTLKAGLADGSALPAWLTFDAATGAFSGAPTAAGTYAIQVTATDPSGLSAADVFTLTVAPPAGLNLTGTAGADVLTGAATDDTLSGLAGADSLTGGAGNDLLDGGAGGDKLDGGAGIDTATYASATAGVTVSLAITKVQDTLGAGKDTLVNIENLFGSAFADKLTGAGSANALSGGAGADTLTGAGGADLLTGGTGADRFVFALADSATGARDTILDFSHAEGDRIDLTAIDAVAGGKDQAFTLVSAFSHKAGELVSVFETDHYVVQGDVNGDAVADFAINVYSPTALVAGDFLL